MQPVEVVVAGHVCLDVIPALSEPLELRPGHLVKAGPAALSTGGAVANVGLALHRLGVPVRLMGKIGDDILGGVVRDVLRAQDAALADGMIVAPGEATSYSIVLNPPGVDRSFLHCPGANDSFALDDVRFDAVAGARIFHFGYPPLMRRMYADGGEQLRGILAGAAAAGAVTSLDLSDPDPASDSGRVDWAALLARVLGDVDVFAPSVDELGFMLGDDDAERLAARAIDLGAAVVALKLGERGLHLRVTDDPARLGPVCATLGLDPGRWRAAELHAPCFAPRRVAGTTGAGDCTIAGLLAALLRGEDPAAAATSATAVGACSVESADATGGIPPWPQVARRIAAGWARLP